MKTNWYELNVTLATAYLLIIHTWGVKQALMLHSVTQHVEVHHPARRQAVLFCRLLISFTVGHRGDQTPTATKRQSMGSSVIEHSLDKNRRVIQVLYLRIEEIT